MIKLAFLTALLLSSSSIGAHLLRASQNDLSCGDVCVTQTWQLNDKTLEEVCIATECPSYPYECPTGTKLCCPETVFEDWGDSINIYGEGQCNRIDGDEPASTPGGSEEPPQPTPNRPEPKPTPTTDDSSCGDICISQTWQLKDKSLEEVCAATQCTSYPYECPSSPSGTKLCCPESVAEEWGKHIPISNIGTCTRIGDGPEPPQHDHSDGSCGDTCIMQTWQLNGKSLEEVCSATYCESIPYECQSGTELCCPATVAGQYGESVRMVNDGTCTRVDRELIAEG